MIGLNWYITTGRFASRWYAWDDTNVSEPEPDTYGPSWPIVPSTSRCGRSIRATPRAGTLTLATSTSIAGSPTRAMFLVTRTPASRSLLFATITAYCVLAASEIPDSLSRSTDQKSQPTFDGVSAAASHAVLHSPLVHTVSPSHVPTCSPLVPSSLHCQI